MIANKEIDSAITINIVTSVIGYGIYFPARIIYEQLKERNYNVNLYIIERYFDEKALAEFERTKAAFKKQVRLVRVASRIPVSYTKKLSDKKTEALFKEWTENKTTHFLCFSGLWLETLEAYKKHHPNCVIDICRVDAAVSSTWGDLKSLRNLITNDVSFFNAAERKINYVLNIPALKVISYSDRTPNVVIHGGGWSLGDFVSTKDQFTDAYHVHLIVNDATAAILGNKNVTCFTNSSDWNPLYKDGFPAFGKIANDGITHFKNAEKYPGILDVIAKSKAIVSKPGGMTLMDSLLTETPLLFLTSVGKNEDHNKILWEALELAMPIERWLAQKDKNAILQKMQQKLRAIKKETPCFLSTYTNLLEKHSDHATKKY